jgi:histone-lysine N-methyltransferase SUV39H
VLQEIQTCHWCQVASFTTHTTAYISIINKVDDESLPKDFAFIQNCVPGEGIHLPDPAFFSGCECNRNSQCKTARCNCLQDMTNPGDHVYETIDGENYMSPIYLDTREPIYECHEACSCDEGCPNRVVEHGRTIPLQIFRTQDGRGWGEPSIISRISLY